MIVLHTPPAASRFGAVLCGFEEHCAAPVSRLEPSSGCVRIVVLLTGALHLRSAGGALSARDTPAAFLVPAGAGPVGTRQEGAVSCVEIGLPPWVGVRLLGPSVAQGIVAWSSLSPGGAADFPERLLEAAGWRQRLALADDLIRQVAGPSRAAPRREILYAWRRLNETRGLLSVRGLADEIGWSERHFSERFRVDTGLLPKAAARHIRFDHARRGVVGSTTSLAVLAAHCGYADQSHMTRDFSELAGATPAALRQAGQPDIRHAPAPTGPSGEGGFAFLQAAPRSP